MTTLEINAPFQTTFTVKTNCDNLVFLLYVKYGKHITKSLGEHGQLITAVKQGDLFKVQFNSKTIISKNPLAEIDGILFENTVYDKSVFALHGAAVEYNDKAYLFLASTTSGKTTLASYLSSKGFGYITDDCILLDRTSFNIYPYNTPIQLRDGGLAVLKRYNAEPNNLEHLNDVIINRYIYTPKNCVTTELPLAKIFFITRTDDENRIVDMSITECMIKLMKAPITNYTVTSDYVNFVSSLAKTDCSQLLYRDMEYVVEVIRNGQRIN